MTIALPVPLHKTPEKPMAARAAARADDEYDSDGGAITTYRSRTPDAVHAVLALAIDTPTSRDVEVKSPAKEATASVDLREPEANVHSRFELPPSFHPSLPSGFGGYVEEHETDKGIERHGYEFFGNEDGNASEHSADMYSAQGGYRDESPDENEFDHDEVFDDDDHSDHGDDVGQEEDDPG